MFSTNQKQYKYSAKCIKCRYFPFDFIEICNDCHNFENYDYNKCLGCQYLGDKNNKCAGCKDFSQFKKYERKFPEIKIDLKYIKLARDLLRDYPTDYEKDQQEIDRGIPIYENKKTNYKLRNMVANIITERAVMFYDSVPLTLHYSTYKIRFWIPIKHILDSETEEQGNPQEITITDWSYKECYMKKVNECLQNHAKTLMGLRFADRNSPYYKYNLHKEIIEMIDNKSEFKKTAEKIAEKMEANETKITPKEEMVIMYCDGAGNIYNGEKISENGHFNIIIFNKKETKILGKWQKKGNFTSNQAELSGVIGSIKISLKYGYKNVEIRTDSRGTINWITPRTDEPDKFIWQAKNPNIIKLVEMLRGLSRKSPNIKIVHINRERNKAHNLSVWGK